MKGKTKNKKSRLSFRTEIDTVKKSLILYILHITFLIVVICGAMGSLYFTLHSGRYNKSVLLILLFVIWVLSPFAALAAATIVSKLWPTLIRMTLYSLVLILTIGSLITYSGIIKPPGSKPAFVFLVVPLISWLLIAILFRLLRKRKIV